MFMDTDPDISVQPTVIRGEDEADGGLDLSSVIRDVDEADGGLDLSLHPGLTDRTPRRVRPSDVIKLWTSDVNQETSSRRRLFTDKLT